MGKTFLIYSTRRWAVSVGEWQLQKAQEETDIKNEKHNKIAHLKWLAGCS